jgi:hypothetical protein
MHRVCQLHSLWDHRCISLVQATFRMNHPEAGHAGSGNVAAVIGPPHPQDDDPTAPGEVKAAA